MRRRHAALAAAVALVALVAVGGAGCSSAHPSTPTRVEGLAVHRSVGCAGWFEVTGQKLAAHLSFTGPVRNVVIRTMSDNGEAPTDDVTVHVPAGVQQRVVYVAGVTRIVTATQATVDNGSTARATCALAIPH